LTIRVWRIACDAPDHEADDLGGKGAEVTGGRWNRPGRAMVYTASSAALACLETVVHLNADSLPLNRYLVRIDIPDDLFTARLRAASPELRVGWDALPFGRVSLDFGDAWLRSRASALLEVPSVIVPEEPNLLINPAHPDSARLVATKLRRWSYDTRLPGRR
jgi:RES domain-containing protein